MGNGKLCSLKIFYKLHGLESPYPESFQQGLLMQ